MQNGPFLPNSFFMKSQIAFVSELVVALIVLIDDGSISTASFPIIARPLLAFFTSIPIGTIVLGN